MSNKRAYWLKATPVLILGIFLMYFYSGLQNDHLNILISHYTGLGWTAKAVTNPATVAGLIVILATFVVGTLLIKFGVVRVLVPSIVILGLSTIGLAFSGTNLLLYSIFLFLVRLMVVPLMMGAFMLCTNWFVTWRGRALGIITIGCPLFTATGLPGLKLSVSHFGLTPSYTLMGIVVLVLAALVAIFVKSKPEDCGLYPDGSDCEIETSTGETKSIPFGVLASNSGFWMLIISFGILQFVIVAVMSFYIPRLEMVGTSMATYLFWISAAALMGMPISVILGIIDDKFGTVIASLVLCITFLVALVALLVMKANQIPMIITAAIGLAGMMGGTPNLHPSITTYVFGRDNYQAANRWIMSIQAIMMAFAYLFMSIILDSTGSLDLAYKIMLGLVVIAVLCLIVVGRKPDHDRSRENAECKTSA